MTLSSSIYKRPKRRDESLEKGSDTASAGVSAVAQLVTEYMVET